MDPGISKKEGGGLLYKNGGVGECLRVLGPGKKNVVNKWCGCIYIYLKHSPFEWSVRVGGAGSGK